MSRRWIVPVLALLVLTACGGGAATSTLEGAAAQSAPEAAQEAGATGAGAAGAESRAADAAQPAAENQNTAGGAAGRAPTKENTAQFGRMVIRNATLSLLVAQVDEAEARVRSLAQTLGGYVLQSETSGDEERRSVRLTFKVPVERFDDTINELKQLAVKVQSLSVSGQDVTEEFVDLESRLRSLRATETRLLEFLRQAKTVEEALLVNQQLTDLQGQIEQAEGRRNFLRESTAFSTINVDLQPQTLLAITSPDGWTPRTAARSALRGLLVFVQGLADITITLAIWAPVWGAFVLAGMLFWRRFGRRGPPPQPGVQP